MCDGARVAHYHHRRLKQAGGSKLPDTNLASNCLGLCSACHALAHGNPNLANLLGWIVPQGCNPEFERVIRRGEEVFLQPDGGLRYAGEDFGDYAVYRPVVDAHLRDGVL